MSVGDGGKHTKKDIYGVSFKTRQMSTVNLFTCGDSTERNIKNKTLYVVFISGMAG